MTDKRFTIISDYPDELGIKENRSGDVIVLNHRDLNSEQFVAQICQFLNDQNDTIEKLVADEKYWEEKAVARIKELEKDEKQLSISFMEFKMNTIDALQKQYDYATVKMNENMDNLTVYTAYSLLRDSVKLIVDELNLDLNETGVMNF